MTINVPIPTQQQLRDRALMLLQKHLAAGQANAPVQVNAIEAATRRETNKVLAFMHAGVAEGILQWLRDHIAKQAVPINATGQWLNDWCRTYGIKTKPAERAAGTVTGSGTAGATLPVTIQVKRSDGVIYQLPHDLTVDQNGILSGSVNAVIEGTTGNCAEGTNLHLVNPAPGINSVLTVGSNGLNGGTDKEQENERLIRLLTRIQNPPHGGSPEDYAMWAMEVPGVTRAWGYRTPHGPCTAGVAFLMDANEHDGIPDLLDRQKVYDYIRHPDVGPPDELFVFELTPKVVDITLTGLTPNTVAVQQAITAELKDLFLRYRLPGDQITGGVIPLSQVRESISIAIGEQDHSINLTADIVINHREVPVLGEVKFP